MFAVIPKSRLARKLIFLMVSISSIVALATTGFQLYDAYRQDVRDIERHFQFVENSYRDSLAANVWAIDAERLAILLDGITRLPEASFVEVRGDAVTVNSGHRPPPNRQLERAFVLTYPLRGKIIKIGNVVVATDLAQVYEKTYDRLFVVLVSNAIKTAIVASLMYLIVYVIVTRNLAAIAGFANKLGAGDLMQPVALRRPEKLTDVPDDIDHVISALEAMRGNLLVAFEEQRRFNKELESRVAQRTDELTVANQRLREARDFSKSIIANTVDGIVAINTKGIIQSFNPAAEQIFGYAASEILGDNVSILLPEHERQEHDRYIEQSELYETRVINQFRELYGRRKDGSLFPLELNVTRMTVGEEEWFLGILRDITERRDQETALRTAKEEAERANTAKSAFLANMSHELRTPLNSILGFAQLLETSKNPELSEKQLRGVKQILGSGEHLLDLINEVLDLARVEAGHLSLHIERFDPGPPLRACINAMMPPAEQRALAISVEPELVNMPEIEADPTRFKQIILNLLSNAIKYNREGGSVRVLWRSDHEGFLTVSVEDTGAGFSDDLSDRVFEPFDRLGIVASEVNGTGIGLTLTKQLVEAMGGHIDFDSTVDVGTTFRVTFPLAGGARSAA